MRFDCQAGLAHSIIWLFFHIFPVKSCGVFQLSSGIGCTCAGLFPCLFSLEHWSLRPTGLFPLKSFQPFHCWLFPSQISRLFFPCPFRYLVRSWPARLHPNDSAGMAETNNLEQLTDVRLSSSSYRSLCIFMAGASAEYPFLPSSSRKGSISWSSTKPNLRSASKDSCMSYHDLKFKNA